MLIQIRLVSYIISTLQVVNKTLKYIDICIVDTIDIYTDLGLFLEIQKDRIHFKYHKKQNEKPKSYILVLIKAR